MTRPRRIDPSPGLVWINSGAHPDITAVIGDRIVEWQPWELAPKPLCPQMAVDCRCGYNEPQWMSMAKVHPYANETALVPRHKQSRRQPDRSFVIFRNEPAHAFLRFTAFRCRACFLTTVYDKGARGDDWIEVDID
jgi:hypothetical protein